MDTRSKMKKAIWDKAVLGMFTLHTCKRNVEAWLGSDELNVMTFAINDCEITKCCKAESSLSSYEKRTFLHKAFAAKCQCLSHYKITRIII